MMLNSLQSHDLNDPFSRHWYDEHSSLAHKKVSVE